MRCSSCKYYSRKKVKGKITKWCKYLDIYLNKTIKKFLKDWCNEGK